MVGPLPSPRHEAFAQAVAGDVGLERVRASVLQTPNWSDTSVRCEAAHKC